MLRMSIEGVGFDEKRSTVVVLKDLEGTKMLPIWIDGNQARSIALELEGARPDRPLSHDLLLNSIEAAGGRVTRVVINDLQEFTFYATIDIDTPHGVKYIDARPSDAIALAVRAKCPVFVDGAALNALHEVNEAEAEEEEEDTELDASLLPGSIEMEPSSMSSEADDEINRFKRLIGDLDV